MNSGCIILILSVETDTDTHWNHIMLARKSQLLNWGWGGFGEFVFKHGHCLKLNNINLWLNKLWLSGKESACQCRRHQRCVFKPSVTKMPWRRKQQPTPVFLPGRSHGQRNLVGYNPQGLRETHAVCLCLTQTQLRDWDHTQKLRTYHILIILLLFTPSYAIEVIHIIYIPMVDML